jgi:uncharacterized protein (TIGR03790 family)
MAHGPKARGVVPNSKSNPVPILIIFCLMIVLGSMQMQANDSIPDHDESTLDYKGSFEIIGTKSPPLIMDREKSYTRSSPEYYDLINYDDVLVIRNLNSPMSIQIADYFQVQRNISSLNICNISAPTSETVNRATFDSDIRTPIENYITSNSILGQINYIVTTKGIPLRISEVDTSDDGVYAWDRACVDSDLALILGPYQGSIGQPYWLNNPYFDPDPFNEFTWTQYGFFLVTRLIGYDYNDIQNMIDLAEIAIGRQGTFVLDVDPGKDDGGGYQVGNDWMREANATLTANGFDVFLDETDTFLTNQINVSGYTSWGSNDGHYPTNSILNPGLETDSNGDDVPDNWYFVNETGIGYCLRNDTEVRNGAWSVNITRNSTSENSTYFAQNYTVKPNTRYYAAGYANLSGVSSEMGVHLQIRAYDSLGNVVQYYNGSVRTGTTGSWVSLGQVHYEPIDGIINISLCAVISKSSGTAYFDDLRMYEIKPHNEWIPGALAETYVSTGGRSFNYPTGYGQSLVADLIRDGVTGVKGYVYEPFLSAIAHPNILFDAYTQGFTMAESYYMASEFLSWMDVVVGDPKLAPYDLDIVPDFSILSQNITFSDDTPHVGTVIEIFTDIENLGAAFASGVEVQFFVGDPDTGIYLGNRTLDIDGSATNITSIFWDTTGYLGDYNITIVIDPKNKYYEVSESNNIANHTVTVHTGYPTAEAGLDDFTFEDLPITFDGSGSTDNTSIANYTWDFGDGYFGFGVGPSHTYTLQGIYQVVLNVTNVFGLWDMDIVNITVDNVVPIANAGVDKSIDEGQQTNFNASASYDTPSDMATLNYTWYFGDGEIGYGKIITHTYIDNGTYLVTLEVRDDDGAISSDILNVTAFNLPPSISFVSPQVLWEDSPFTLQINATDVLGDTITFLDNCSIFDISQTTGLISFTPVNDDVGVFLVNISAMDEDGGVSFIEFEMTVENTNDPPYIVSTPITEALEETLYQYDVVVQDDDLLVSPSEVISYSLDLAPQGMFINSTGSITWIPNDFQASLTFDVIVNITDGDEYDIQMFIVNVTNINDAPVIHSSPVNSVYEDSLYTYEVNATDVDLQDVLSYSLDLAPEGISIDPATGFISWSPENDQVGNNDVIVNVSDLAGAYITQEFTILVNNVNDPPSLDPIVELTSIEDEPFYYQVSASDEDLGDELSFFDDNDLFQIDKNTGEISFTPSNDEVGTYIINITVKDKGGAQVSEFITFTVLNVNDPPSLDYISNWQLTEDEIFVLTVAASDIDLGDSITFRDNTTLFDIDEDSGEISFTPANEDVGTHLVNISVIDEHVGFDYQTVLFIVENVNDPPILDFISDCEATEDTLFTLSTTASDEDLSDSITFHDDTTLFEIDEETGVISFTPTNEDVGVHVVNISVMDEEGAVDYQDVTFTILNVNDPPEMEDDHPYVWEKAAISVGETFYLKFNATDSDSGDTLTFSDDSDMFDIDSETGEISFTPDKKDAGTHEVTITVKDNEGASDSVTITFEILGKKTDEDTNMISLVLVLVIVIIVIIILLLFLTRKKKPSEDAVVFAQQEPGSVVVVEKPSPPNFPPPPS